MKVLVTGASGFVGSRLVPELEAAGYEVVVAGRRRTPNVRRFHAVGDIGPGNEWNKALEGVGTVIHLAARVHIMRDAAVDPMEEFRRVNVAGTLRLAQQAIEMGVGRFVYISSIKVNGEATPLGKPFSEKDMPAPEDPYGITKWEAEQGIEALAREAGMELVIIRPPLIYGPGVKGNFATLINWVAKGVPLPLGAVKENRRSFIGLDNLVDLIVTCVDHPAAANQIFLASDGEDLSTADLLHRLARAMRRPARLVPVPKGLLEGGLKLLGRDDLAQRLCGSLQVDITKTCERLGWKPPVTVDEGLRRAVAPLMTGKGSP